MLGWVISLKTNYVFFKRFSAGSVCFDPPLPKHGVLVFARDVNGSIEAGAVARYQCEPGYLLVGPGTKTCREGGRWEPLDNIFCAALHS